MTRVMFTCFERVPVSRVYLVVVYPDISILMAYPATMAQMRKLCSLTGTSNSEGQGVHSTVSECRVDRFSSLPDGVAHHIVSFLTLKDLTRLGSSSKRCRQLYLSPPSLHLELSQVDTSTCDVDRFLNLRGIKTMHRFSVHWWVYHHGRGVRCVCRHKKCRIISWIENALRCEVEVMNLRINLDDVFSSCILLCGSLRALSVDFLDATIKTPSFSCSSNLESLDLTSIAVDAGFFKWISSSFKCIKELRLRHVYGVQDITTEIPSLKSFTISEVERDLIHLKISGEKLEDIRIQWFSFSHRSRSLNIFAPNLKYLQWSGEMMNHQLGNLLHLEKARICLLAYNDLSGKASDFFISIHKVKVLHLQLSTIMILFKEGFMSVPPLHDVSYLHIDLGNFNDKIILGLVSLLRAMPNLSTLCMNSYALSRDYRKINRTGYDMQFWKSQDLPFISHLKEVNVELSEHSHGSNPIELLRYILEHAENLKKMVIVHPPRLARSSLNKLNKSKKTSNAKVVFHRKERRGLRRF